MIDIGLLQNAAYHRPFKVGQRLESVVEGSAFGIVISGRIDSFRPVPPDGLAPIGFFGPGQAFGQEKFFGAKTDTVYRASAHSMVFLVEENTFDALVQENPRIAYALLCEVYKPKELSPLEAIREKVQKGAAPAPKEAQAPSEKTEARTEEQVREAIRKKLEKAHHKSMREAGTVVTYADSGAHTQFLQFSNALFPDGHKGYPGVEQPTYKKYTYKHPMTCPYCGSAFEGDKIFYSKLGPSRPMRYDTRMYYYNFQVEWYDIVTCPHCYFSMFASYFAHSRDLRRNLLADELAAAKGSVHLNFSVDRDLDYVFAVHYIALRCAAGYLNHHQLRMQLWAGLSWLYEDAGDQSMAMFAATNAVEAGNEVYTKTKISPMHEQQLSMFMAGMLYRVGERENIRRWLYKAKTSGAKKQIYVDLANDLMEKLREEQQLQKQQEKQKESE